MATDSKRDSQTVQFSDKPAPDLGQGSEYCVDRSRKGGYSGDRNRDSSSVAAGYVPAYDSKDQERGHVSQRSSFAVTSGPHTLVDSQLPVTGTHQPVFPYHQSYVSQREEPCHGQAYQSLTKPKVGDYRNQSSTTSTCHPIVLESGYPSSMLSSNCLCPQQVEKSFGPRDGHVQVQGAISCLHITTRQIRGFPLHIQHIQRINTPFMPVGSTLLLMVINLCIGQITTWITLW